LLFNLELKIDSIVSVNIVNKNNNLESIELEKYEIKGNNLNLLLVEDLKKLEKYSITIISLD
jgi:hypothetical protein